MSKNLMVIFASATLALVGCSDKDSADDSGAADGTDGADGTADGADGTAGAAVSGAMETYFADGTYIGTWSIAGETVDCGACAFGFDADFTNTDPGDSAFDISRQVEFDSAGYVYTDGGEYWGYGGAAGGYAYWVTYDSSTSGYYYYGYVNY